MHLRTLPADRNRCTEVPTARNLALRTVAPIIRAVLDIKYIRQEPDAVRERRLVARGEEAGHVDELLALDEKRRALVTELETLQADRNAVSKEIGALMGQGKKDEAEAKKAETREMGDKHRWIERGERAEADDAFNALLLYACPTSPTKACRWVPMKAPTRKSKSRAKSRPLISSPRVIWIFANHLASLILNVGPNWRAAGFLLYTGWGARLERAMIQFLLDLHVHEHGYTEVSPPFMVQAECMEGVGQFPKFLDQAYAVQEGLDAETLGKRYLIPTAEAPVANLHRGEILDENELPKYYCATARASGPRPARRACPRAA